VIDQCGGTRGQISSVGRRQIGAPPIQAASNADFDASGTRAAETVREVRQHRAQNRASRAKSALLKERGAIELAAVAGSPCAPCSTAQCSGTADLPAGQGSNCWLCVGAWREKMAELQDRVLRPELGDWLRPDGVYQHLDQGGDHYLGLKLSALSYWW